MPVRPAAVSGQGRSLAARLPRPADWLVTPMSRTRRTAETIFAHGYPVAGLTEEPGLIEQSLVRRISGVDLKDDRGGQPIVDEAVANVLGES